MKEKIMRGEKRILRRGGSALWTGLSVFAVTVLSVYPTPVPTYGALSEKDISKELFSENTDGSESEKAIDEPVYTAADGNQIDSKRLQDNLIEYDELGSLVHYGNLSIQQMMERAERTKQEYQEFRDYLRTERDSANEEKKKAKGEHDMESYAEYAALEAIYSSSVKSYNEMLKKLDRYAANQSRISTEKQLTSAAQSLMLSWQSLELQKEYLEAMAEFYQAIYENTKLQQSAGLATESDVSAACQNWNNIKLSLTGIENQKTSICQNLYLLLGTEEKVSLEKIPPVNLDHLAEIDLEADIQKAIGNNTDVISERNVASAGTASANKKQRTLEELEEKVRISMVQLYEEVHQKKLAYDAAQTGLDGAELAWENVQNQYALGLLSRADYLEQQMQYIQKKTAFSSADLALFQALEAYRWGVKGILTLE